MSDGYDLNRLLTLPFENNKVWRDLADTVTEVLKNEVVSPRQELSNIRDPLDLDRIFKILNTRQVGIDFTSDSLSDEDYDRLYRYVSLYWPEGGTEQFVNFIGFIKNIRLIMFQLWSDQKNLYNDYGNFNITPGTPITKGGDWFPTSHIELHYEAENSPNPDLDELTELFYLLAPIHLVLERFVGAVFGSTDLYFGGNASYTNVIYAEYKESFEVTTGLVFGANAGYTGQFYESN